MLYTIKTEKNLGFEFLINYDETFPSEQFKYFSNDECLADADAPYTLAYAVIMLNTDQHNANAGKTNIPMTNDQVE